MITKDTSNEVERLSHLKQLLELGRFDDALRFFSKNSNGDHINRFSEFLRYRLRVDSVEDYLVIRTSISNTVFTCVVGLDDNNKFFCHMLPTNIIPLDSDVSSSDLRRLMGFDYHAWEVNYRAVTEGRIRLQGDIALEIRQIFQDLEGLASYLVLELLKKIISLIDGKPKEYTVFLEPLWRGFYEFLVGNEERYDYLLSALMTLFSKNLSSDSSLKILQIDSSFTSYDLYGLFDPEISMKVKYVLDNLIAFAEGISELERKLELVLGRHRIRLFGISGNRLARYMNQVLVNIVAHVFGKKIEAPFNFDTGSFVVLREHELIALHPEHKSVAFSLVPGIYRIDSLNSIMARIQRILRIKMLLVGPPHLRQRYVERYTQRGFNNSYSHVIGANFYVMRDTIVALPFGSISIEYLIWTFDLKQKDRGIRNLYYRGSRGMILLVDLDSESFVRNINRLVNDFWRLAGLRWPILIIAEGDCKNDNDNVRSLLEIVDQINRRSGLVYFVCATLDNEDLVLGSLRVLVRGLLRRLHERG